MLPSLPSLAPRDSYNLWYTPTHHTSTPSYHESSSTSQHQSHDQFLPSANHQSNNQNHGPQSARRPHQHALHRTPLSRLVADETYQARRRANIQNYGNSWLRPPGVPKSLSQIREEEREIREHLENLRREALAQELAEAEAAVVDEDGMRMEEEEVRNLDDDIPEGDGIGGMDDDDDLDEEDQDEDDDNDDEGSEVDGTYRPVIRDVRRAMEHMEDDPFGVLMYGGAESEVEEYQGQMLQEEDLVHEQHANVGDGDTDMMDADLDDEIPEATLGGYEHTDTEEECSSSEDESVDMGRLPPQTNFVSSMVRSDGTQNSTSSLQGSSPRQRTRASRGSGRG